MAQSKARQGDYTGRMREKLAADHAEAVRAREDQLAMVTAANFAEDMSTVTDVVGDRQETQITENGEVVYVEAPAVTIRVNSDVNQMTFGVGNTYTFKEGHQYRVTAELARHLEELGLVWH